MMWGSPRSFPRAILHVDGDAFFASCEVSKDPRLRGKPVITGKERGIVSACTYDVKRRGVKRGMRLNDALKIVPDAIVLPSDYETYSIFSERMYAIVRRYTPAVEEYSIDECFADLTGLRRTLRMDYAEMAAHIKKDLQRELGMTFSAGLSASKVLAKIASKWQKPNGLTIIMLSEADKFLAQKSTGDLWGVGHNTAAYLAKFGIRTALDFARRDEAWVRTCLSKPFYELWRELHGEVVFELATKKKTTYQSISKTKTFTPPSREERFVFAQLSKNIENACIKARRWNLATPEVFFFLKTQDFKYRGCEVKLSHATAAPQDILASVIEYFPNVYRCGTLYRATGVMLLKLHDAHAVQLDLFGDAKKTEGLLRVFESIDELSEKYGKHVVFLGSSLQAMKFGSHLGARGDTPLRAKKLFRGETPRRRLSIPMLGEVS